MRPMCRFVCLLCAHVLSHDSRVCVLAYPSVRAVLTPAAKRLEAEAAFVGISVDVRFMLFMPVLDACDNVRVLCFFWAGRFVCFSVPPRTCLRLDDLTCKLLRVLLLLLTRVIPVMLH